MAYLDNNGLAYFWKKITARIDAEVLAKSVSPFIGFLPKTTVFSTDGKTITETDESGNRLITVFVSDTRITETYRPTTGTVKTRTTVFNSDGSITETIT